MSSVLKGVRVVEGSAFIAAPMAGMSLAQLGADVIRFDQIGGGIDYNRMPRAKNNGRSLYWTGLNKGKRSLAVDLKNPQGRELIQQLITQPGEQAGIFLTNFAGVKWLTYEALRKHRNDLIKIEISGNYDGSTAVDYTVNCAVGFPFVTGPTSRDKPVNHVLPAWDVTCSLQAALGVTSALMYRQKSGLGQEVKLALSDMALSVVGSLGHIAEAQINGEQRPVNGNFVHGAFGRDFGTRDGRRISAMAISNKQWQVLCKACDLTEKMQQLQSILELDFNIDEHRYEARVSIAEFFERWCQKHTLEQIREIFDTHGVCWDVYQDFIELVAEDPRCSEKNPMFNTVEQPGVGPHLIASTPLSFSEEERKAASPAPVIGQHTDEILADVMGLTSVEIGRLHDEGIVAGAPK
ncbi:CoA transferase [Alteromonas sp. M12]|uniref:CoA transferase n=1 Tax=Alteromonas sp. M12 TaxID=3135644 RepID=UPI00319DEE4F